MKRKTKLRQRKLNTYRRLNLASSIIWVLAGLGILGFGIYYREIFEKIFGPVALVYGLITLSSRKKPAAIKSYERGKLTSIILMLIIYSLVNPLGNIALIFDLVKRDWVLRGGLDEKA